MLLLLVKGLRGSFMVVVALHPEEAHAKHPGKSFRAQKAFPEWQPAEHKLRSSAQRGGRHLSLWKPKLSSSAMPAWPRGGLLISLMATARRLHAKGDIQYAQIHLYTFNIAHLYTGMRAPQMFHS